MFVATVRRTWWLLPTWEWYSGPPWWDHRKTLSRPWWTSSFRTSLWKSLLNIMKRYSTPCLRIMLLLQYRHLERRLGNGSQSQSPSGRLAIAPISACRVQWTWKVAQGTQTKMQMEVIIWSWALWAPPPAQSHCSDQRGQSWAVCVRQTSRLLLDTLPAARTQRRTEENLHQNWKKVV